MESRQWPANSRPLIKHSSLSPWSVSMKAKKGITTPKQSPKPAEIGSQLKSSTGAISTGMPAAVNGQTSSNSGGKSIARPAQTSGQLSSSTDGDSSGKPVNANGQRNSGTGGGSVGTLAGTSKITGLQKTWEKSKVPVKEAVSSSMIPSTGGSSKQTGSAIPSDATRQKHSPVPLPSYVVSNKRSAEDNSAPLPKRQQVNSPSVHDFEGKGATSTAASQTSNSKEVTQEKDKVLEAAAPVQPSGLVKEKPSKAKKLKSNIPPHVEKLHSHLPEELKLEKALLTHPSNFLPESWEQWKLLTAKAPSSVLKPDGTVVVNSTTYQIIQKHHGIPYNEYRNSMLSPKHELSRLNANAYMTASTGGYVPMLHCLFPQGYKLLPDASFANYICPVRDCRQRHDDLRSHGEHFQAVHNKMAMNDNLDQTFTVLGEYESPFLWSPAVVVSMNRISADAPPPVEATLSPGAKRSQQFRLGPTSCIMSVLSDTQTFPQREDIKYLSKLPVLRDIPSLWIKYHGGDVVEPTILACALAYIVGELVTDDESNCKHTGDLSKPSKRLSLGCIRLPEKMPEDCKLIFSKQNSCVGCRYVNFISRQLNMCSWNIQPKVPRTRNSSNTSAGNNSTPTPTPTPVNNTSSTSNNSSAEPPEVSHAPLSSAIGYRLRSSPSVNNNQVSRSHTPMATPSKPPQFATPAPAVPAREPTTTSASSITQQKFTELLYEGTSRALHTSEKGYMDSRRGEYDKHRLEDWEFAPGRIQASKTGETVAFSSVYVNSLNPITIADDIGFHRLRIPPGGTHAWKADTNRLKYCEVITGKLDVKLAERSISIGPGGLFVIRPGWECTVQNRTYSETVLSCHDTSNYVHSESR